MKHAEHLQKIVDRFEAKLASIYAGEAAIEQQIASLEKDKEAVEEVLAEVSGSEKHHLYVLDHIEKVVGRHGTYGISDMIKKLKESKKSVQADKKKYVYLVKLYQAILNGDPLPDVPETPEEDPDAACSDFMKKKPDFHYCDRSDFPRKMAVIIGDQIMVRGVRYSCRMAWDPEIEDPPDDWLELWEAVGQQQTDLEMGDDALVHIGNGDLEELLEG